MIQTVRSAVVLRAAYRVLSGRERHPNRGGVGPGMPHAKLACLRKVSFRFAYSKPNFATRCARDAAGKCRQKKRAEPPAIHSIHFSAWRTS
jgi:hypothetical protein